MHAEAERPFLRRKTSYSMLCRWVCKENVCWSTLRALEQVSRNLFWPMLAWISGCPSSSGSQPRQKSSRALVGHETTMKSEKSSRWRGTRAGPRARGFPHVSGRLAATPSTRLHRPPHRLRTAEECWAALSRSVLDCPALHYADSSGSPPTFISCLSGSVHGPRWCPALPLLPKGA